MVLLATEVADSQCSLKRIGDGISHQSGAGVEADEHLVSELMGGEHVCSIESKQMCVLSEKLVQNVLREVECRRPLVVRLSQAWRQRHGVCRKESSARESRLHLRRDQVCTLSRTSTPSANATTDK